MSWPKATTTCFKCGVAGNYDTMSFCQAIDPVHDEPFTDFSLCTDCLPFPED